tara:strand:+ start:343 stop:996 length:654 start_codon:yes stop_codon:yes gene_type:complete
MKFSKEDIKFLDNYLENSDVIHVDIRMEMVDHVATAIEREMSSDDSIGFYDVFKDYMLENKRLLLENNKQFLKQTTKKLSDQLLKALFSLRSAVLAFLIGTIIYFGFQNFNPEHIQNLINCSVTFLIFIPGLCYFFALKAFNYERFSGIERLSFYFIFLLQFINIINLLGNRFLNNDASLLVTSILMALVFTFILVFIRLSVGVFKDYTYCYKKLSQ